MDLTEEVYTKTKSFPKEEIYGITFQIRKSAVSIPSNISEGAGRNSDAQFKHFLEISMGWPLRNIKKDLEFAINFR